MRVSSSSVVRGLVLSALVAGGVTAQANVPEPVFIEGGQYTVVLRQEAQQWRLLRRTGHDLIVTQHRETCAPGATLPTGVWLVVRDAQGRPELLAPSVTELPPGQPDRVALRACGESNTDASAVVVPKSVIRWLATRSSAVYVDR